MCVCVAPNRSENFFKMLKMRRRLEEKRIWEGNEENGGKTKWLAKSGQQRESERKAVFGKSRPFGYHIGVPNIMKKLKILWTYFTNFWVYLVIMYFDYLFK